MENNYKLMRCPFCGGEVWVIQILEDLYAVECRKCWMRTGTYQPTKAEAIKVWNRRAERIAKVEVHLHPCGVSGKCCACGGDVYNDDPYCSHCGAKLDWSE